MLCQDMANELESCKLQVPLHQKLHFFVLMTNTHNLLALHSVSIIKGRVGASTGAKSGSGSGCGCGCGSGCGPGSGVLRVR